jgi:hypothetical protein
MREEEYMTSTSEGNNSEGRQDMDPASSEGSRKEVAEISIHFGKGLCGEPFHARDGKTYMEIKIPNGDPGDSRPWESFILPEKSVHENKFGKGLWAKLPEDGHTTLRRPVPAGKDEQGKTIWKYEKRSVSNAELKNLVEFYKTRDHERESVTESLKKGKVDASRAKATADGDRDDPPFR